MVRPRSSDYIQLHRFRIEEAGNAGSPKIDAAGFASVTIPTFSTPEVTYRDGMQIFTIKQAGIPEFDTVTLRRGVARRDTDFFKLIKANIDGGEYRKDLVIHHFHGDQGRDVSNKQGAVRYILKNAFVVSYKASDDLDATSGEISLEEVVLAFEELEVEREAGSAPSKL